MWAIGPIRAIQPTKPGDRTADLALQVRLLDDSLAGKLQAATSPDTRQPVRLGADYYQLTQPARLLDEGSWDALRRWPFARAWQIRFLTPACFRRGSRTSPWPAPETIARGLTGRWKLLHPDTAPKPPPPGAGPVWVSDIDGRSEATTLTRNVRRGASWRLEDETISGFTGRIRYVCDQGTDDEAATFNSLIAFAHFAGVGSHTTYGFGAIASEPTWQPPSVRPSGH
jgi:hypothetical protein